MKDFIGSGKVYNYVKENELLRSTPPFPQVPLEPFRGTDTTYAFCHPSIYRMNKFICIDLDIFSTKAASVTKFIFIYFILGH